MTLAFSISPSLTKGRTGSIKGGDRNFGGKMKFTMMLLIPGYRNKGLLAHVLTHIFHVCVCMCACSTLIFLYGFMLLNIM